MNRLGPLAKEYMINLYDKDSGAALGTVGETDLKFLVDQLEEESADDQDYYINADLLDVFKTRGAGAGLLDLLRRALGDKDGVEIRWERT